MPDGDDATASAFMMYHNHNNRPKWSGVKEAKEKYYKRNRRASFAKIEVKAIIDLGTATWR
jgi:hypothetical protein